MNLPLCLQTLDEWANRVRWRTDTLFRQFERNPADYHNSANYFRILAMITVLQKDLGVRYNPAKIDESVPLDTADTFIHGIIQGDGGTCASMPVLYVAVGRRLGYPLSLVSAKYHFFARWDEPAERFNIEATGRGLNCHPDDYYRMGRYLVSERAERLCGFLKSQTPAEELAGFLAQRAFRLFENYRYNEAEEAISWSSILAPNIMPYKMSLFSPQPYTWSPPQGATPCMIPPSDVF
ncbi:hypothetical protein AYO44_08145 [Planctomycetaceae bacterium SCGC AG-212-F19]|nr:hypothetical protein AYO44_08145 [Planctomycetaceae bacterium SCGC AG-212-F19]